jgi:hypothetical protein
MRLRVLFLIFFAALPVRGADPVTPITVCEVLADLPAHEGKDIAVLGRYSFRRDGRWISEESCGDAAAARAMLWLTEDGAGGPKPPGNFEIDAAVLNRKFAELVKRTTLGKFRFGTPDYDRWAVVYGRVVSRKGNDAAKAPADLVFRGSGVVVFLTTER